MPASPPRVPSTAPPPSASSRCRTPTSIARSPPTPSHPAASTRTPATRTDRAPALTRTDPGEPSVGLLDVARDHPWRRGGRSHPWADRRLAHRVVEHQPYSEPPRGNATAT